MYDYYGVYKSCRDAAWRCHIDFCICSLPVSLLSLAHAAGIRIIKDSDACELRENESGAGIFLDGQWIIVYDDKLELSESRMVIAHELGHNFLGHEYKYADMRFQKGSGRLKSEREADLFAMRLLAPACVLHELGASSAKEIADLCSIPRSAANKRARRMTTLENRNCFYKSSLETKVAANYRQFIDSRKSLI